MTAESPETNSDESEKSAVARAALASVGAVALAGDAVAQSVNKLAKRGEKATQGVRERVRKVTGTLRKDARETVAGGQAKVEEAGSQLKKVRDDVLGALRIPTHATLKKLSGDVEQLSAQIAELDRETPAPQAEVAPEPLPIQTIVPEAEAAPEPLPGYAAMNVDTVNDHLPALDEPALLAVRTYEQAYGKRVTVLRAVERTLIERLAARGALDGPAAHTTVEPLPRYAHLAVEEIGERLHGLDDGELLYVKIYEQEHQNRETVLRAIEERMGEKVEA